VPFKTQLSRSFSLTGLQYATARARNWETMHHPSEPPRATIKFYPAPCLAKSLEVCIKSRRVLISTTNICSRRESRITSEVTAEEITLACIVPQSSTLTRCQSCLSQSSDALQTVYSICTVIASAAVSISRRKFSLVPNARNLCRVLFYHAKYEVPVENMNDPTANPFCPQGGSGRAV
jgi:hypothetical protein